ncbi:MAG: hypothetical protein R2911_40940 [Caldilineaceae bacterium]
MTNSEICCCNKFQIDDLDKLEPSAEGQAERNQFLEPLRTKTEKRLPPAIEDQDYLI